MKKKIFSIFTFAIFAAMAILASSCGQQPQPSQSSVPVPAAVQTSPTQVIPPCAEPYSLQQVLAGIHGVDGYGRPLNACGYPVNVYGEPIEDVVCPEVFYHQPAYDYLQWLTIHYGFYHPVWGFSFYHPYYGPSVIYHRVYTTGVIRPSVHYIHSVTTVTTHAPAMTVRPSAPANRVPAKAQAPSVFNHGQTSNSQAPSAFNHTPAASAPASTRPVNSQTTNNATVHTTSGSAFQHPTSSSSQSIRPAASSRSSSFRRH